MIEMDFAKIGLAFVLPSPGNRVAIEDLAPILGQVYSTLAFCEQYRDKSYTRVMFKTYQAVPTNLERFASRFNDQYHTITGSAIIPNGPMIAHFTISVPDKDNIINPCLYRRDRDQQNKYDIASTKALNVVANLLANLFRDVGFPDFFTEGQGNKKILQMIYPAIKDMEKDIESSTLIVCDAGKCDYSFSKTIPDSESRM